MAAKALYKVVLSGLVFEDKQYYYGDVVEFKDSARLKDFVAAKYIVPVKSEVLSPVQDIIESEDEVSE